jgi:hypothetical protein
VLTDQQKTDVRRFCGYPAYGAAPGGNDGWRFFTAYGLLEYRMANLAPTEEVVVQNYLSNLTGLEFAVTSASQNLDTNQVVTWQHNKNEVNDRMQLFLLWCSRLCQFLGVAPGPGLNFGGCALVV